MVDKVEAVDIDYVIGLRDGPIEDSSNNLPIMRLRRYLKANGIKHSAFKNIDTDLWHIDIVVSTIKDVESFLKEWNISGYRKDYPFDIIRAWSDIPFKNIDVN